MKVFQILGISILLASCGANKEASTETVETTIADTITAVDTDPQIGGQMTRTGIVKDRSSQEGCGFIIHVDSEGFNNDLDPGVLDDEFKVEGLEVEITFDYSRRMSTCDGTMPIILRSIKKK